MPRFLNLLGKPVINRWLVRLPVLLGALMILAPLLLLVESDHLGECALVVDSVQDQRQVVIKTTRGRRAIAASGAAMVMFRRSPRQAPGHRHQRNGAGAFFRQDRL